MRLLLAALIPVAALAGCASPEDQYVSTVRDSPTLSTRVPDEELIRIGRSVCEAVGDPGVSRETISDNLGRTVHFSQADASTVIAAAKAHLCPGAEYSSALTPEQAFLADIDDTPGFTRTIIDADTIALGRSACDAIGVPGVTPDNLRLAGGRSKIGPIATAVIIDAAEANLCPEKKYSTAPGVDVSQIAGQATPTTPAEPIGPLTSFGDGLWEVGVDVAAGKYKTSGGSDCYWSRLKSSDTTDYIDNSLGAGPQTVQIKAGEYFQSQRCGTWSKAG